MIQPRLNDELLEKRLAAFQPDGITIFTLENDTIRGALVNATTLVATMRAAHRLGPLETMVLGKACIASSLLSATIKGDDRIALKVEGDGPAQGFWVECNASGDVRGRLFASPFEFDEVPDSLDTAPLVGSGTISLTRFMAGRTEPVTGSCVLKSGRIAEDLAWYYHISEQTRSSFTVGLHLDAEGRVAGAGGLFLQALPGASEEALDRVERLVYGMPALVPVFRLQPPGRQAHTVPLHLLKGAAGFVHRVAANRRSGRDGRERAVSGGCDLPQLRIGVWLYQGGA